MRITMVMNNLFRRFAASVSSVAGRARTFIFAIIIILIWAFLGPAFGFSNTWQLFINTFTTIVTLLMVFIIQNTQNRDSKAIHAKLDELIKAEKGARKSVVNLEEQSDEEIEKLHSEFRSMHDKYSNNKNSPKKAKK